MTDATERITGIDSPASLAIIDARPTPSPSSTPPSIINARTAPIGGAVPTGDVVSWRRLGASKWPTVEAALAAWALDVARSEAQDFTRRASDICMTSDGTLTTREKAARGHAGASVTLHGLRQLMALRDVDFSPVELLKLSPSARAHAFNDVWNRRQTDRSLVVRTARAANGAPVIRAAVSELHSREKGDDLALINVIRGQLQTGGLPPDARMRVFREWNRTSVELVAPSAAIEVRKGDVVYARQTWINSEVGASSFVTEAGSLRLICLNGMTAASDTVEVRVKHVGDIARHFRTATIAAMAGVQDHLRAFVNAQGRALPSGLTRSDVIDRMSLAFKLPERVGVAAAALWDADGEGSAGNTLAGLANAFTRAAQAENPATALEVERAAGRLISGGFSRINA